MVRIVGLVFVMSVFVLTPASAGIDINSFSKTAFNSDTSAMNATLGLGSGYVFEDFEDTSLVSGLSVTLTYRNGAPDDTVTSLASVFRTSDFDGVADNEWAGTGVLLNTAANLVGSDADRSNLTTFNFAGGASSVGIGLSNFQSLSSPGGQYPITDHRLYINGVLQAGTLEDIVGSNWTPGRTTRNTYLRFDANSGDVITSIGFENINSRYGEDLQLFDHVAFTGSPVPEPASLAMWGLAGALGLVIARRRNNRMTVA